MDTRRHRGRVPRTLREELYQASGGVCQKCGAAITLDTFHVAHLRAHAHGGALVEGNLEAWCAPCNLTYGAADVSDTRLQPREWQRKALDPVVARIIRDKVATVSAAPGAGKTVFAGLVFDSLRELDVVDRLLVLAPKLTLLDQWADSLYATRHIELKPGGEIERAGQDGIVQTYQSLSARTVEIHRREAERARTLLVLDEVHHVAERVRGKAAAWAQNVTDLAGTVDQDIHVAGVLNLSGTLWRSHPRERISTVRYELADDRLVSSVDFDVPPELLIDMRELRPIDLYRLDARVRIQDWAQLEIIESNLADLDEYQARAFAGSASVVSSEWKQAFVSSVLDRLRHAHESLDFYPAKALIVASRQDEARAFREEVDRQMRERGLRPLAEVAVSDDRDAARTLERFRTSKRVGVLCTVDMAGEGYDCPDIAVIGYASRKMTALYVRQVVARAQRVTERERELARVIPAAVVVPDIEPLVEQLVAYLAPMTHEVMIEDEPPEPQPRELGLGITQQRYVVDDVDPQGGTVTVPQSDTVDHFDSAEIALLAKRLESVNVPSVYAPRIAVASRRYVSDLYHSRPFERLTPAGSALESMVQPPKRSDSIEDQARILKSKLSRFGRWWEKNGDTPVAKFAGQVNTAGGIPNGGRDHASVEQLKAAEQFASRAIADYCNRTGTRPPTWRS